MYLSEALTHTCSMFELTGQEFTIEQFKGDRKKLLSDLYLSYSIHDCLNSCKAIIYNCPKGTPSFIKKMKSLGFKKVLSYKGNDKPIIHTYITKITLKERKKIAKDNNYKYDAVVKEFIN